MGHLESLKSQFTQRLGQASMQPRRTNIIDSGPDVSLESNSGVYLSGKAEIGDILDKKTESIQDTSSSLPNRRSTLQAQKQLNSVENKEESKEHQKALQYV